MSIIPKIKKNTFRITGKWIDDLREELGTSNRELSTYLHGAGRVEIYFTSELPEARFSVDGGQPVYVLSKYELFMRVVGKVVSRIDGLPDTLTIPQLYDYRQKPNL